MTSTTFLHRARIPDFAAAMRRLVPIAIALLVVAGWWAMDDRATKPNLAAALMAAALLGLVAYYALRAHRLAAEKPEAALRDSETIARAIIENAAVGIATFDPEGSIETVNPAWGRIFGYDTIELLGQKIAPLLPDCEGAPHWIAGDQREAVGRRKDGTLVPIDLAVDEVQLDGGRVFTAIANDISARKAAERTLRDNQRRLEEQAARLERHAAELSRSKHEIEQLAFVDMLTGLPNRNLFHNRLDHAIAVADRSGRRVALMMVDLNRFKTINDALGHAAGDIALREVGARLRTVLREADTVARVGGDEFAVILETGLAPDGSRYTSERIIDAFEVPILVDGASFELGVAIGVAVYPDDAADADTLLRRADAAMYRAKTLGASAVVTCSEDVAAPAGGSGTAIGSAAMGK